MSPKEAHTGVTFILIMAIFIRITYIEYVLFARYSSKYFTCFSLFNSHNDLMVVITNIPVLPIGKAMFRKVHLPTWCLTVKKQWWDLNSGSRDHGVSWFMLVFWAVLKLYLYWLLHFPLHQLLFYASCWPLLTCVYKKPPSLTPSCGCIGYWFSFLVKIWTPHCLYKVWLLIYNV